MDCRKTLLIPFLALAVTLGGLADAGQIKIGFLVKQPEEPWFQLEWKFADQAATEFGFEVMKIGATDGEKVLTAIDNLAASGAQGFVICTPDVLLGPAIMAKSRANNLKVIAVDDRFVGPDGKDMESVHYLGISARKIGNEVGKTLMEQVKARGWNVAEVGFMVMTFDELPTIQDRTEGAIEAAVATGFPADQVYKAPIQQRMEIPTALDAANTLLTRHPTVKKWIVAGGNDSCVLGAIRALEGRGVKVEDAIGVGINGTDCIPELEKANPTSFYGSFLLSAREHGYLTAKMMYEWIKDGKEPPLDTRTVGTLITRDTFRQILKDEGIAD
ncbi:MAG: arabinose ABC transporter substrate-binding protein [Planctomycetaceae bacterium]|nr:arabinose ABC transporter substrate-binding protein [Planctomycetaceae bacterium]